MPRVISPPLHQLDALSTPLNDGERQVLHFFDNVLPDAWEIYVQPFLNGLRPDFVLLNPSVGIAVFEVKAWSTEAYETRDLPPDLFKRGSNQRIDNPITKISRYKDELIELYCPRLNTTSGRAGLQAVTAGVIMTRSSDRQAQELFAPLLSPDMRKFRSYYPISGRDSLASGDIVSVFPESQRATSHFMNEEMAEDLRHWLREPAFSREQRQPIRLDARQLAVATRRTPGGLRRVRGPAGSGKTAALAARAAHLAAEGRQVLVCSYNLTLINYIRDLAAQYGRTQGISAKNIAYLNFHRWCKRVCHQLGFSREYEAIWSNRSEYTHADRLSKRTDDAVDNRVPNLTRTALKQAGHPIDSVMFDAILVDEGQDWRPEWWNTLRLVLREGGEMLLVADMTQDVYGTAERWTEQAMVGAGFRGPWFRLEQNYRLPRKLTPLLRQYAAQFLPGGEADVPQSVQQELDLAQVALRWRQTTRLDLANTCVEEIVAQMGCPQPLTAISDITFLADNDLGRDVVEMLGDRGIEVTHTYDENSYRAQRQKMAFRQGVGKIKATTWHSFKGWESAQLVVAVSRAKSREARAGLYAALTRLQRTGTGSALTVVNAEPDLRSFGQKWPHFSEHESEIGSFD